MVSAGSDRSRRSACHRPPVPLRGGQDRPRVRARRHLPSRAADAAPKGPGAVPDDPIVDHMVRVDLRTVTLSVPPQEVITKDNVPVRVNAVAYFRIIEPNRAIIDVENYIVATSQIARRRCARCSAGELDALLSERERINPMLQTIIDEADLAVGDQGLDRRGQGRRNAGQTCSARSRGRQSRARTAREDHLRRRRVPGLEAARRRRRHHVRTRRSLCSSATCRPCSRSARRTTRRSSSRCRSTC